MNVVVEEAFQIQNGYFGGTGAFDFAHGMLVNSVAGANELCSISECQENCIRGWIASKGDDVFYLLLITHR